MQVRTASTRGGSAQLTHDRKCGRVVCNACSPHRIIIPHQYIVRPPGSEIPMPQSLLMDSLGVGYIDVNGMSGGERVRLCNPCVPDPNVAPPQGSTSTTPAAISPRSSHQRSRSSIGGAYGVGAPNNRYGMVLAGPSHDPFTSYTARNRSITMVGAYARQLLTRLTRSFRVLEPMLSQGRHHGGIIRGATMHKQADQSLPIRLAIALCVMPPHRLDNEIFRQHRRSPKKTSVPYAIASCHRELCQTSRLLASLT